MGGDPDLHLQWSHIAEQQHSGNAGLRKTRIKHLRLSSLVLLHVKHSRLSTLLNRVGLAITGNIRDTSF